MENHLLQLLLAVCLNAAIAYGRLREQMELQIPVALISASLALTVLAVVPFRSYRDTGKLQECDKAYAYVKQHGGTRILSDNVGMLLLEGKPVTVSDPFVFHWLVAGGRLPDRELNQLVQSQYFDSVVLWDRADDARVVSDLWPASTRRAVADNYTLTQQFTCDARYVYERKSHPAYDSEASAKQP